MAEVKKVVVSTIQRLESTVNGHNSLVKDVQGVFMQQGRQFVILDRTLADKFGKDKWAGMVKSSETSLADEMVKQMKAEEKRKEAEAAKPKEEKADSKADNELNEKSKK